MTEKTKKVILTIIEVIMAIILFVSLFFNLTKIGAYRVGLEAENGFNLLDLKSDFAWWPFEWKSVILGIFCLLIFVVSIVALVWSVFELYFILSGKFKKLTQKKSNWIALVCWVFSLVYFLCGYISSLQLVSELKLEWYYDETLNALEAVKVETFAYIPLIIMSVLLIVYIIMFFIKTKEEKNISVSQDQIEKNIKEEKKIEKEILQPKNMSLGDSIETLREYKKLLEEEVISQEEFDVIKASLLNKIKI